MEIEAGKDRIDYVAQAVKAYPLEVGKTSETSQQGKLFWLVSSHSYNRPWAEKERVVLHLLIPPRQCCKMISERSESCGLSYHSECLKCLEYSKGMTIYYSHTMKKQYPPQTFPYYL